VITIPAVDLATTVVKIGNSSGREIDKLRNVRSHAGHRRQGRSSYDQGVLCDLEGIQLYCGASFDSFSSFAPALLSWVKWLVVLSL
jgi:hypothetical protein